MLAILAALLYGTGDFAGGLSARYLRPLVVGFVTHAIVIVPLLIIALTVGGSAVTTKDLVFGIVGALTGGAGVVLLYRALAAGPMSLVSPITALIAAIFPIGFGVVSGERPNSVHWLGVALACLSIVLVTGGLERSGGSLSLSTLVVCVTSGISFGFYFVTLTQINHKAGFWPLLIGRVVSSVLFGLALVFSREKWPDVLKFGVIKKEVRVWFLIAVAGFGDSGANLCYYLALKGKNSSTVAILASLYPAMTVILATRLLKEPLSRPKLAGLLLAAVAVSLVAAT